MVEIREIHAAEVPDARRVIYTVALELFQPELSLEEASALWDATGTLADMDDIRRSYFENGGTFLVMLKDGQMIGTGALRRIEEGVCELKRLWLLKEYHGQGLGYQMMTRLLEIARARGYHTMRLETDATRQTRAIVFYRRLGFVEIPRYGDDPDSMAMEMRIDKQ